MTRTLTWGDNGLRPQHDNDDDGDDDDDDDDEEDDDGKDGMILMGNKDDNSVDNDYGDDDGNLEVGLVIDPSLDVTNRFLVLETRAWPSLAEPRPASGPMCGPD
ncbi:hypothetical protein RRG08_057185 [Elysia crispata]|uniref:Uncharacterized protein n=1 Tax=Elysia crispata TaxID=231223 RepID=A0AAE0XWC7_9GAST|nr:hypothetical protein RRG08_057185 [Elysia crispata]